MPTKQPGQERYSYRCIIQCIYDWDDLTDCWLVKIIVLLIADAMIASLGKKIVSKIFINLSISFKCTCTEDFGSPKTEYALGEVYEQKTTITYKNYVRPRVKTSIFLASKPFLSIVDHLQATFSPDLYPLSA